jgi:hypothetical protein
VLEKARTTKKSEERANLLGWLQSRGLPRAELVPIAVLPFGEGEDGLAVVAWLAQNLATRAAWDAHGFEIVSALMAGGAHAELGELCAAVWSEACRTAKEPPRGLLQAIEVAFAKTLLGTIRGALGRGSKARAMAALSALACLDLPSRMSQPVHDLRRADGAEDPDVAELIAVNERLVKHNDGGQASLEGVIAALHAIADAFGGEGSPGR